jgi:hypothetical protein
MGVYELSGAGSVKTGRTLYTSMNANNQYGAMVPIQSATLTSTQSTIFFSNIPQNYQDLICIASGRSNGAYTTGSITFYLNVDSGASATAGYSVTNLIGDGASASSARGTTSSPVFGFSLADGRAVPAASSTSGVFASYQLHILNYANRSTFKTGLLRVSNDLNGSGISALGACLWQNTSAISSIMLATNADWVAGTTFTLYGIRAVSS